MVPVISVYFHGYVNPKWYDGMLRHGYEGVRQIETHVTNTLGWSATTGKVAPWVYQQISDTFLLFGDPATSLKLPVPRRPAGISVTRTAEGGKQKPTGRHEIFQRSPYDFST